MYVLNEMSKIDGYADVVRAQRFDELESGQARAAYRAAESRARQVFGTQMTFTTAGENEITGVVKRQVVELLACKVGQFGVSAGKVVDQSDEFDRPGCRLVLEAGKNDGIPANEEDDANPQDVVAGLIRKAKA